VAVTAARGVTVWITGLPAAGKTTLALALRSRLRDGALNAVVLDGDDVRGGLSADLDHSRAGRRENVRRVAETAALLAGQSMIVLVSVIAPYRADRAAARRLHDEAGIDFAEVWVATPVEECARRDPKGLYRRAAEGRLSGLTGWDAPYEEPRDADAVVLPATPGDGVEDVARLVLGRLA
jgi:bifunctional enzyme CysN/CysC